MEEVGLTTHHKSQVMVPEAMVLLLDKDQAPALNKPTADLKLEADPVPQILDTLQETTFMAAPKSLNNKLALLL